MKTYYLWLEAYGRIPQNPYDTCISFYLQITQQIAFYVSKFEDMKAWQEILILQRSKLLPTVVIRADVTRKGVLKIITMFLPYEDWNSSKS
jgi:hypothetical protein